MLIETKVISVVNLYLKILIECDILIREIYLVQYKYIIVVVLSILLHQNGHSWTMLKLGFGRNGWQTPNGWV